MRQIPVFLAIALALAATSSFAQSSSDVVTPETSERAEGVNDGAIVSSGGFLSAHPDMRWRLEGQEARRKERYDDAITYFRRAARYGDKPSQGVLGEMYFTGTGVPVDRPLGYAWMDLAAERGYPFLLAKRENYWNQLSAAERERAVAVGTELYAEFGDEFAKPRLEVVMRRERRNTTGSRTGHVGNLTIQIPTPGGTREIRGNEYYADKFWEPALYWRWQDHDWRKPGMGVVEVGAVMTDVNDPALEPETAAATPAANPVE
jgi:hypothetical protein